MVLLHVGEDAVEVERQRRDEVDYVDRCARERQLAGTDDRPCNQLEREPYVTDTLDVEERVMRLCSLFVEQPRQRSNRHSRRSERGRRWRVVGVGLDDLLQWAVGV